MIFALIKLLLFFRSSEGSSDTESESSTASDSSSGDEKADRRVSGRKTDADNKAKKNIGMLMLFVLFLEHVLHPITCFPQHIL